MINERDPRIKLGRKIITEIKEALRTPGLELEATYGVGEGPFQIMVLFTLIATGGSKMEDIGSLINDHLLELLKEPEFEPYEVMSALEEQPPTE